ncbi:HD-GYP domain-containing protein [Paenibacillus albicereus]|uniref:HD-GYP domain-containing protein n=1 Tax=Paenibacillus albicereus TaxID=2726185 RepID=A0A6H2H100_9BACL|nr:HD-GYP domain-containing protein [Paenibacillus albicereus]QJC53096.1 HD-GYP domain-containing protein [Paenibacillus albicereus]
MILMPLSMCRPGMRLAKKVLSGEGLVLLGEGFELTSRLIDRLEECQINFLYIQDEATDDIQINELISEDTMRVAMTEIRASFRQMMEVPQRRRGAAYPFVGPQLRDVMNRVIDDLSAHKESVVMLMNMASVDNYLYQHSFNVCVYTTMLGIHHGYSRDELTVLGMGALLHDVGKTMVPVELLKKPGMLTREEFDEMKRHTEYGYELLRHEAGVPAAAALCALQHHERLDGSGYPFGLKGGEIHEFSKWIGMVDSYDAMTTNRIYREPMLPHQAVEALYAGTGTQYEQTMVQLFRDKVAIYPVGMTVRLKTGEVGVVVDVRPNCPHRPVVRVLRDDEGVRLRAPYEIDMSLQLTRMIAGVNDELPEAQLAGATS